MAGKTFCLQHTAVDDQADCLTPVVFQTQDRCVAWLDAQKALHIRAVGKGQAGDAQLTGEVFGLEGLVPPQKQQVEFRFLAVAEK